MILLLGGSGYVGHAFQKLLVARGIPYVAPVRSQIDYANRDNLKILIKEVRPEFVINAAGYTGKPNVDASEVQKLRCLEANAVLPGIIAEICDYLSIPCGHVSSGCIYNGAHPDGSGFNEEDGPNFTFRQNNCSFYSGTKALGEEVLAQHAACFIWRLRIPFNEINEPRNYLYKMMNYERLVDVANSISQLGEFARACLECWLRRVPFGIYNVTNPGSITTREVVEMIQNKGLGRKEPHFFKNQEEFHRLATRTPRASCLMDSSKLLRTGIPLTEVHDALEWALTHWRDPVPELVAAV